MLTLGFTLCMAGCNGGSSSTPQNQAPLPVAADPWSQPLGAALEGVTFSDGWQDLHELPAPVQIQGGWTDSLMAAPTGDKLYFAYERIDFFDFYISNGAQQIVTGPAEGLTGNTFKIYQADLKTSGWSVSLSPVNSSDPSVVEASPAVNASGDLMVYTEFDPYSGRASLYYSSLINGVWTSGTYLIINSAACNDDNAKIVGDLSTSVTIYFESTRQNAGGTGSSCATTRGLYYTTYSNGSFTPVVPVPGIAIAGSDDSQPFITQDQKELYWTGIRNGTYGIFKATRQSNNSFGDIHAIAVPTTAAPFSGHVALLGEASVVDVPEGKLLYMMCGQALNRNNAQTWHDADFIWLKPCVARLPD